MISFKNYLQHIDEAADAGLAAKASKSGISIDTLRKVYHRGMAAWNSGHRPGTTPQQWGMARVNSYITKGKGTYGGADKDLHEGDTSKLPRVAHDKTSGLPKKYVAGLSKSTAKARAAHFDAANKLSDSDPRAYTPAPGDATAKTKISKHTLKYRAMFGEDMDEEIYEACWNNNEQIDIKKIDLNEAGLWDNIHAKQQRIKNGSGEHMRKPGSTGAPTAKQLKLAKTNEAKDPHEYGYEGDMALNQLATAQRCAQMLKDMLKPDTDLPEWIQSKITLACDYLQTSADYMYSEMHKEDLGEASNPAQQAAIAIANKKAGKKPKNEEVETQFDLIEEVIEKLAEINNVDSETIWETFESLSDEELLQFAEDAKGYKNPTGGLTQKGRDYYNNKFGSHLQAPVTTPPSKLKPGSKAANRRKSFCARMSGVEGPMKKPNGEPTRKALALRKWNC